MQREKGTLQETIVNLQVNFGNFPLKSFINEKILFILKASYLKKGSESLTEVEAENKRLKQSNSELAQEQESLLTLLAEMEAKIKKYRHLLRLHGENLDPEDENDEDEETGINPRQPVEISSNQDAHQPPSTSLLNLGANNVLGQNGLTTDVSLAHNNDVFSSFSNAFQNSLHFDRHQSKPTEASDLQSYFK